MTNIIDGKALAETIKDNIFTDIKNLTDRPNLAIILVGKRPDSCLYVNLKEREGKKVGIDTSCYKFDENITEDEIKQCINFLNNDEKIDGILLQLPLPSHLDEDEIVALINPDKDVDGFHPENIKKIKNNGDYIMPPLAAVVLEMLRSIDQKLTGTKVALIANSDIFTNGIGEILKHHGAELIDCKSEDKNLVKKTLTADIIVTAVGKKYYLTSKFVKDDAVVIDIGIVQDGNETYGDVDFDSVKDVAAYISPVPGGVGPMTIAFALKNVLQLYRITHNT